MPSRRKQQTGLAFNALPSSSPAAKDYRKQIRDRAAAVTIEGSPSPAKRRKVTAIAIDGPGAPAPEPTPILAGNADNALADRDKEPILPPQRRTKSRPRQQRLDFTNLRAASSIDAPVKLPSSSVLTQSSKGGTMFSSQAQRHVVELSSDGSDIELPSAPKLNAKAKANADSTNRSDGQGKPANLKRAAVDSEDDSEDDIVVPSRRFQKPRDGHLIRSSRTELKLDSDDDGIMVRPPRAEPEEISDEDDEDMPTTLGTQRRRATRRRKSLDNFITDSPPGEDSEEEGVEVTKRFRKRRRPPSTSRSEDSEKLTPKSPHKHRIKRSRQTTQREKDELAEDLDFLGPSSEIESSARQPRSSQSTQKAVRQQALERLKRTRGTFLKQVDEEPAEQGLPEEADEEGNDSQQGVIESDNDNYEDAADPTQFVSSSQMFKEDAEDAKFLADEDEDGLLGVPSENLPIEFTKYASMKSKDLFEFAVEWMVQRKINPAFQRDDPLYQLTFKKLDDEVRGLAASKFTSSAWTATFTTALNARPEMRFNMIDRGSADHWMRDKCDACNRTNHPATFEIQFVGKPYDRMILEDIDNGEDDDNEDDDASASRSDEENAQEYDANGTEVAPSDTVFYVGKFCCANARTAHQLQHWRYHLNAYVEVWLERQGYGRAEQVHKRDKWSTRKRRKYANKIVDRMKAEGEIKLLWKTFRDRIEEARTSKQGRFEALSP